MEEEDFKTRLKSAKNRAKSKYSESKEPSTSGMGHAFKMSTELVAAVAVGTITVSYTHLTLPTTPYV